jgi:hypothetical protein
LILSFTVEPDGQLMSEPSAPFVLPHCTTNSM